MIGGKLTQADVVTGPGSENAPVVLLVEDEVLIRLSAAEMLREQGYVVLEAADATEALALFGTGHPLHLVITDVRMPGEIDGLALMRKIKKRRPHLPVALVSGHLAADAGHEADGFLRKPYAPEQFLQIARDLIEPQWQSNHSSSKAS
jgi:CheY-like chemotaxis protein